MWNSTTITSESQALHLLTELYGKGWLCRGHSSCFGCLVPSIDRGSLRARPRIEKLSWERQSIDLFRSTALFFSHPGEQAALADDITTLMVLRHYEVPTRLLDWSRSPYVAAYFACENNAEEDGELWSFDEPLYEQKGKRQWERWPQTTSDGSGKPDQFRAGLTAFTKQDPPDWFICGFYGPGFHRQNAQYGVYTLTAQFDRDHADAIANVLIDDSRHHRYVISAPLKAPLRTLLRERHGVWRGSLFPDPAGAAQLAKTAFPK